MPQSNPPHIDIESVLEACLAELQLEQRPLCVAFSGGMDSSVLLHALGRRKAANLRAVYVNHQLQPDAANWAQACVDFGARLGVPVTVLDAEVDQRNGKGLEAAARDARYSALAACIKPNEVLLTAHHQQDQLETYLLQLFRGAGLHGLAAMGVASQRGALHLVRPLLNVPAAAIRSYAESTGLDWIDDPTNTDLRFDRNFLRQKIVPQLLERWPAAASAVARAARLSGEAIEILDATAAEDLADGLQANRLRLESVRQLVPARRHNALRFVLRSLGLTIPSEAQLADAMQLMLEARPDGQPAAAWAGTRIYRFRDCLWFYAEQEDPANLVLPAESYAWDTHTSLEMGPIRGTLKFVDQLGAGIAVEHLGAGLAVRFRQGGERLRPSSKGRTRELKNLLQETEIPPWMRCHIPLIYNGNRLLAAGDLWVNADYAAQPDKPGRSIIWSDHSAIR